MHLAPPPDPVAGNSTLIGTRIGTALLVAVLLACAPSVAASATSAAHRRPTAILVLIPPPQYPASRPDGLSLFDQLAARPELSLGLVNATQSSYSRTQALLDISQGTRVSRSTYAPPGDPVLTLRADARGAGFAGWADAKRRAAAAPASVHPGLLAGSVPGGAAYVSTRADDGLSAIPAADGAGRVALLTRGATATIAARARGALRTHRFVVVSMPARSQALTQLDAILNDRRGDELVLVVQAPPAARGSELLRAGMSATGTPGTLTSATTRRDGIVAAIDVLPTILRHLELAIPADVHGEPIMVQQGRSQSALEDLSKRLRLVGGRRTPTIVALLLSWLALGLALTIARGRAGAFAARRLGALTVLWIPTTVLLPAALHPSRTVELLIVVGGGFVLAAATDRLVRWPRGPLAPMLAASIAYTVDLARDSTLTVQSLLGSNPRAGSRFYGIGNELEAALSALLLLGVAAALSRRAPSRSAAAVFAIAGAAGAAISGSGRLGADVGGVITLGTGTAVATVLMLPGGVSRRALAFVLLTPAIAIASLAARDLATAGNGHFTRSVLHARSIGDLANTLGRRYELAFHVLRGGLMPLLVLICLLTVTYAVRFRERIYAPLRDVGAWRAGLLGGLSCGIAGMLFNDSGPLLLVVTVFVLASASAYLTAPPVSSNARLDSS